MQFLGRIERTAKKMREVGKRKREIAIIFVGAVKVERKNAIGSDDSVE